jgi:tRNA uridine 5-carbamoylmethylation protein Kti12
MGKNLDRVEYEDFDLELDYESFDDDELRTLISEVASVWLECDDDDTCKDLKYALVNLELALGTRIF